MEDDADRGAMITPFEDPFEAGAGRKIGRHDQRHEPPAGRLDDGVPRRDRAAAVAASAAQQEPGQDRHVVPRPDRCPAVRAAAAAEDDRFADRDAVGDDVEKTAEHRPDDEREGHGAGVGPGKVGEPHQRGHPGPAPRRLGVTRCFRVGYPVLTSTPPGGLHRRVGNGIGRIRRAETHDGQRSTFRHPGRRLRP